MLVGVARKSQPQSGTTTEGAPEFLLPSGARAIGMGQAAVALPTGAEAVWWNPALLARAAREASFHFAQTIATEGDYTLSVLIPVQYAGAFAITARYIDYGVQQVTGKTDPNETGVFSSSTSILGASFATSFGRRLSTGLMYKVLAQRFQCTGTCLSTPHSAPATFALDLGAQYTLRKDTSLWLGAAVRNLGLPLQVHDAPQADPLPRRAEVGIAFSPTFRQLPADARVRGAFDIVTRLDGGGPGYRVGGELSWQEKIQLRAGYVYEGPTGTNGSFGLGYRASKVQFDFAQLIGDAGSGSGQSLSFISIRYGF